MNYAETIKQMQPCLLLFFNKTSPDTFWTTHVLLMIYWINVKIRCPIATYSEKRSGLKLGHMSRFISSLPNYSQFQSILDQFQFQPIPSQELELVQPYLWPVMNLRVGACRRAIIPSSRKFFLAKNEGKKIYAILNKC